jgi:glutamine amidotransferase
MIVIIDYGAGNVGSIQNMLRKIGAKSIISSKKSDIENSEKLILPGVGSFDYGMSKLKEHGLDAIIKSRVNLQHIPILGICLGAQLMGNKSEEGTLDGLSLVDMEVHMFDVSKLPEVFKIPHMGWTEVELAKDSVLFKGMYPQPRFYFVHSYHFVNSEKKDILGVSNYGYQFVSAFEKENIYGVQFHPEKSHKFGMKLLENFVNLV